MATLEAGQDIVLIEPDIYWAMRFSPLPNIDQDLGDPWPDEWTLIRDTVNGLQVTHRNPTVAIVSEERDRIASVRGANSGTALALQALTFTDAFWKFADNMSIVTVAAQTAQVAFKFATGTTVNGNLTITLPGLSPVTVAVTTTSQGTAPLVATAVAAATYTGWTAVVDSADNTLVVITKTGSGAATPGTLAFGAASTGVTLASGYPKYAREGTRGFRASYVDPEVEHNIMLGFEGMALAGSAFEVDTKIRGFAYRVENTQNGVDVFRRTGNDAIVRPSLVLEALPEQIQPEQLDGSGIPSTAIDPRGKFNYFDQPDEAA